MCFFAAPCRPPQASRDRAQTVRGGEQQHIPGVYSQIPAGQSHLDLPEEPPADSGRGEERWEVAGTRLHET